MSRKRCRFDPISQRASFHKKKSTLCTYQEAYHSFAEVVLSMSENWHHVSLMSDLEPNSRELEVLLVQLFGLKGVECLRSAVRLIPKELPSVSKVQYIKNITAHDDALCDVNLTDEIIAEVVKLFTSFDEYNFTCTLRNVSESSGVAYTEFLTPPTSSCLNSQCRHFGIPDSLYQHHRPTTVTVFSLNGPKPATKICLKCRDCNIIYNYSTYGKKFSDGERFYDKLRGYVEVTDVVFCDRRLLQMYTLLSLHSWVSFSGFAEMFFQYCIDKDMYNWMKTFVSIHNKAIPIELSRQHVSMMFFKGEVEEELRENPSQLNITKFNADSDFDLFMQHVEERRVSVLYPHNSTEHCKTKGCGKCWALDGNWKLTFPVCMFPVKSMLESMKGINLPNICPEQPLGNTAFCSQHLALAQERGYPTSVRDFASYCRRLSLNDGESDDESDNEGIENGIDKLEPAPPITSVSKTQGTEKFLQTFPAVLQDCDVPVEPETTCRKDLGDIGKKLRHWSRGHLFVVRGCGHIDTWKPIYKSESPSQVFIIVLEWLMTYLANVPTDKWEEIILSYDNMCHLDSMKVAQSPLPLPQPFDKMWLSVTKVIDDLHIKNHKDEKCRAKYSPSAIKEKYREDTAMNFMSAEQVFAWLSRFKRILTAMPKTHHMFYLHRLVKKRNSYTELCYKLKRKPLLPKRR